MVNSGIELPILGTFSVAAKLNTWGEGSEKWICGCLVAKSCLTLFLFLYLSSIFIESVIIVSLTPSHWFGKDDSFVTSWVVACQAPLSMGFLRQDYWTNFKHTCTYLIILLLGYFPEELWSCLFVLVLSSDWNTLWIFTAHLFTCHCLSTSGSESRGEWLMSICQLPGTSLKSSHALFQLNLSQL